MSTMTWYYIYIVRTYPNMKLLFLFNVGGRKSVAYLCDNRDVIFSYLFPALYIIMKFCKMRFVMYL